MSFESSEDAALLRNVIFFLDFTILLDGLNVSYDALTFEGSSDLAMLLL
jgi:hypothetical protein